MLKYVFQRSPILIFGTAVVTSNKSNQGDENWWSNLRLPSLFNRNDSIAEVDLNGERKLTGWDRLYIMYSRDEFGYLSTELNAVLHTTYTSFFVGSMYGVISCTKQAHQEFIERNQASQFANVFEARKKLQDAVLKAAFKGMFKYGSRLALFSGALLGMTVSLMVYFERTSVFHYATSGAVLGALHKWKLGPRGMLVGGFVGGLLGFMAGGLTSGMFIMTGTSMYDVLSYQASVVRKREKQGENILKASKESENVLLPLLAEHDDQVKHLDKQIKEDKSDVKEVNKVNDASSK